MTSAKAIRKKKVEQILTPQIDDYKALLQHGDRENMLKAYSLRNNNARIHPDRQGSDHLLGLLFKNCQKGHIPYIDLKHLVPYLPEPGDIKVQRRTKGEKEDYIEEEIHLPNEL